jgi:hypothetical protein
LLFVEQLSRETARGPQELVTLLSSLTLGNRLQWEVFNEYADLIEGSTEKSLQSFCSRMAQALVNVEKDALFRERGETGITHSGLLSTKKDKDRLLWAFPVAQREDVRANLEEQAELKRTLLGALDSADRNMIAGFLPKLQRLNNLLTAAVAKRYHDVLREKTLLDDGEGQPEDK